VNTTTHGPAASQSTPPDHREQARHVREFEAAMARGDHNAAAEAWAAHQAWQQQAAEFMAAHAHPTPTLRRTSRPTRTGRTTTSRRSAAHSRRTKATNTTSTSDGDPSEPSSPAAAPGDPVEQHAAPEGVTA
jgi:hypothetical protein